MVYAAFFQVDWVHLFGYMFDRAPVTRDTYVVVLEQDYVNKFTAWINNLGQANKTRSVRAGVGHWVGKRVSGQGTVILLFLFLHLLLLLLLLHLLRWITCG